MTKEKPILFSGEMVRAILDGRKTQTRRVVKPQPQWIELHDIWAHEKGVGGSAEQIAKELIQFCPYGLSGNRLWVRETWAYLHNEDGIPVQPEKVLYAATDDWEGIRKPSIFMPRWASRLTLEVVGVRVERLQNLSEEDAKSEGLSVLTKDDGRTWKYGIATDEGIPSEEFPWKEWRVNPIEAYAKLWNSINGNGPWESNPWVWVVEFKNISADIRAGIES